MIDPFQHAELAHRHATEPFAFIGRSCSRVRINPDAARYAEARMLRNEVLPAIAFAKQRAEKIVAHPSVPAGRPNARLLDSLCGCARDIRVYRSRPPKLRIRRTRQRGDNACGRITGGLPFRKTLRAVPGSMRGGCKTFERKITSVTHGTRLAPRPKASCRFNSDARRFALRLARRRGLSTVWRRPSVIQTQLCASPSIVPGRLLISTSNKPAGPRTSRSTSLTRPSSSTNSKFDHARQGHDRADARGGTPEPRVPTRRQRG